MRHDRGKPRVVHHFPLEVREPPLEETSGRDVSAVAIDSDDDRADHTPRYALAGSCSAAASGLTDCNSTVATSTTSTASSAWPADFFAVTPSPSIV